MDSVQLRLIVLSFLSYRSMPMTTSSILNFFLSMFTILPAKFLSIRIIDFNVSSQSIFTFFFLPFYRHNYTRVITKINNVVDRIGIYLLLRNNVIKEEEPFTFSLSFFFHYSYVRLSDV